MERDVERAAQLAAARRRAEGRPTDGGTLIESFQYPRKGPGMMWDAAAAKIKQRGGRIHMGTRLESLRWNDRLGMWTIGIISSDGQWKPFWARHVVSSAPIRELVSSIRPLPACKAAAENLRYRDFLTVALIVDKPDLFPDNWIYIHEPSVKVGRIQNFRSWSPEMVPDSKLACLGLEYFCFEGDGLWNASDAELIALAKKELAIIGLATEDEVKDGCVVRQKKAYPVYDESYKANVEEIRSELAERFPTLHLVGRNGMHKYNNGPRHDDAMLTVKNIMAGETLYDVNVNEDAETRLARPASARRCRAQPGAGPHRRALPMLPRLQRAQRLRSGAPCVHAMIAVDRGLAHRAAARATLVSAFALALDFSLFLTLTSLSVWAPLAGVAGYAAGTVLHYLLSVRFVFDARATDKAPARLFSEFAVTGVSGMAATAIVIAAATDLAGLSALPAKVLAAAVSFLLVFVLRRGVVFSAREAPGGLSAPTGACCDRALWDGMATSSSCQRPGRTSTRS